MYFGRLLAGFVGVIVFLLLLVIIFGHGGKKPIGSELKSLPDYSSTSATVSFTTNGIVNADDLHRSIRITVSNYQTTLDVLQGYNPRVIQSKTFENNQQAYEVFLKSINNYGFLSKRKSLKVPADERGQCPLGYTYVMNLNQDGVDLFRSWSSTCGVSVGNSAATLSVIQQLFQNQVSNYQALVQNVNLSATAPSDTNL